LAYDVVESRGTSGSVLNAADEVAVGAFLDGRIGFTAIARVVEQTLEQTPSRQASTIEEFLATDQLARSCARGVIERSPATVFSRP
jgi:1-deoxy-D-xylulose-5-phosphate reductoisomerase